MSPASSVSSLLRDVILSLPAQAGGAKDLNHGIAKFVS
jgi:hypothetical protein